VLYRLPDLACLQLLAAACRPVLLLTLSGVYGTAMLGGDLITSVCDLSRLPRCLWAVCVEDEWDVLFVC